MFKKINRATSSEVIVKQILEEAASGRLQPGAKLPPEREMAEMFGVCRASVREATRALTLMGYLEVYQGKGAFLKADPPNNGQPADRLGRALGAVDSLDLIDIRNLLECKAAALAAERTDPDQLEAIQMAVKRMGEDLDQETGFYQADLEFHQALAQASSNQVLIEIMSLIRDKMVQDRDRVLGFQAGDRADCLATAEKVLEAVRSGEGEEAAKRMDLHLRTVVWEVERVVRNERG
jgi:GntR family transcriptional repressor for pyruvate dehydrogenase complex